MIEFTIETEIERPVADVFAYVTDPNKIPTWQTNTVSVIQEGEGVLEVGTRLREVHRALGGKELVSVVEVSEYELNRTFGLRVVEGRLPIHLRVTFQPTSRGTLMRFSPHGQPTGVMRLAQPLLRRVLRRQFTADCARLKRVLEQPSAPASPPEPSELALQMKRVLPAPRPLVFKACTEPDELAKWWGPRGFTAPGVEIDLRMGGSYRIAMQPPDGDLFHLSGEFLEVDPPARLSYTFRWEDPDPDDQETVVTLSLRDLGASTELLFTQRVFATEGRRALHEQGWKDALDRLQALMSQEASGEKDDNQGAIP